MAELAIHPPRRDYTLRKMSWGLTIKTTDLDTCSFPDYIDPFNSSDETMTNSPVTLSPANRLLGKVKEGEEPSRHPSPQPTHFSVPLAKSNGNGHRILRSATVGYVAPEFKGRDDQMKQGKCRTCCPRVGLLLMPD